MHEYTLRRLNDHRLAEFDREAAQRGLAREARRRPKAGGRLEVTLWTRRTFSRRILVGLGIGVLLASATVATAIAGHSDLDRARAATARFNSLTQAEKAGYGLPPEGPLSQCIASFDDTGAMGFHYINGTLLDAVIDPTKPEALVYAEDANGKLRLAALEYVVFESAWTGEHAPMLFGQMFMKTDAPNRYEIPAFWALHVWIWEDNPSGLFASFNPRVSC